MDLPRRPFASTNHPMRTTFFLTALLLLTVSLQRTMRIVPLPGSVASRAIVGGMADVL